MAREDVRNSEDLETYHHPLQASNMRPFGPTYPAEAPLMANPFVSVMPHDRMDTFARASARVRTRTHQCAHERPRARTIARGSRGRWYEVRENTKRTGW